MIYAPIKYKKMSKTSPFYLRCISYSATPYATSSNLVELTEKKEQSVLATSTAPQKEVKPVCKQSAREKFKQFSNNFSGKMSSVYGKVQHSYQNFMKRFSQEGSLTEEVIPSPVDEATTSKTDKLKAKFNDFTDENTIPTVATAPQTSEEMVNNPQKTSRLQKLSDFFKRNKSNENERNSVFARLKAKILGQNNVSSPVETGQESETPSFIQKTIDDYDSDVDEIIRAFAIGILNNTTELDETYKVIALNLLKEQANKSQNITDKTKSINVEPQKNEAEDLDKDFRTLVLAFLEANQDVLPSSQEELDETLKSMALAISEKDNDIDPDLLTIANAISESGIENVKNSNQLKNATNRIENRFTFETIDETLRKMSLGISAQQSDNNVATSTPVNTETTENTTAIAEQPETSTQVTEEQTTTKQKDETTVNIETTDRTSTSLLEDIVTSSSTHSTTLKENPSLRTKFGSKIDAIKDFFSRKDTTKDTTTEVEVKPQPSTTRSVVCTTTTNATGHKRKSYYALKVENAKKRIVNFGSKTKAKFKKAYLKIKTTVYPEVVDYEDKDDYQKYGIKETRICEKPLTQNEATTKDFGSTQHDIQL